MSDFTQALVVGGGMAGFVIATQYGRHAINRRSIIRPLALVGGFGFYYLNGAPTTGSAMWAYAVAATIGLVFAAVATAATRVERDRVSGALTTVCGLGFVATWLVALGARLAFVALSEHDAAFHAHLGRFLYAHQLPVDAIAPFFMIWALTMVAGRLSANLVRASRLPAAPVAAAAPLAGVTA